MRRQTQASSAPSAGSLCRAMTRWAGTGPGLAGRQRQAPFAVPALSLHRRFGPDSLPAAARYCLHHFAHALAETVQAQVSLPLHAKPLRKSQQEVLSFSAVVPGRDGAAAPSLQEANRAARAAAAARDIGARQPVRLLHGQQPIQCLCLCNTEVAGGSLLGTWAA